MFVWSIIFLVLTIIEYNFQTFNICGSGGIVTGKMWFMYFCMSCAAFPFSKMYELWIKPKIK